MTVCQRCGADRDFTMEYQGKRYGSECYIHVSGKKPTKRQLDNMSIKTIWMEKGKYKYFRCSTGKWIPMLYSEFFNWKRDGETIFVPRYRYKWREE